MWDLDLVKLDGTKCLSSEWCISCRHQSAFIYYTSETILATFSFSQHPRSQWFSQPGLGLLLLKCCVDCSGSAVQHSILKNMFSVESSALGD